jgi:long-chain acyl-CoA synthetase
LALSRPNSQLAPSNGAQSAPPAKHASPASGLSGAAGTRTYWRVEGSLVDLGAVRPIAYFTWNSQSFSERWARRGSTLLLALVRPALYVVNRIFATRVLHTLLAGVTRDRLDLLGEEYFEYVLKPQLKSQGVAQLKQRQEDHGPVILVSQGLDHVMQPLARHLGVEHLISNRLEFRHGVATGRLLDPVVRPRSPLGWVTGQGPDGHLDSAKLIRDLGWQSKPALAEQAICPASRDAAENRTHPLPLVVLDRPKQTQPLSVHRALAGKNILLIGVTGFIGKVWLAHILTDLPEVGKIYLLVRRQRSTPAERRFERIVEESPVFQPLEERYGDKFAQFIREHIEVVEGDAGQPGLGIDPETRARLARTLDVVVNSSGLTDFNPDLRDALAGNVEPATQLIAFLRESNHAALLHLSTCYVVGARDGRVAEELQPNYTPLHDPDFDAEHEWEQLKEIIRNAEVRSESPELLPALERLTLGKPGTAGKRRQKELPEGAELETLIRKNRIRWLRNRLTHAGMRRARRLGWPNTYTFSKSLAESLILSRGAGLPIAIARPSIVESSTQEPFSGWNEGINTSAPLSYLLGTYFRQLPTNARKCLDVIPVDMVCRGMTLIAAALVERRQEPVYQLATSGSNPCDMGRSIELTGLAHRKHYRAQQGLEHWLRLRFETIPVSKERYDKLSVPAQMAVVKGINRAASLLPIKKLPLARQERDLARIEKLIQLYEPFILYNEQIFESDNVQLLSDSLPESERTPFSFDPSSIDWWNYWINVHIPALRKWCYPLIEGRPPEPRPHRQFRFAEPQAAISGGDAAPNPTWPSS